MREEAGVEAWRGRSKQATEDLDVPLLVQGIHRSNSTGSNGPNSRGESSIHGGEAKEWWTTRHNNQALDCRITPTDFLFEGKGRGGRPLPTEIATHATGGDGAYDPTCQVGTMAVETACETTNTTSRNRDVCANLRWNIYPSSAPSALLPENPL